MRCVDLFRELRFSVKIYCITVITFGLDISRCESIVFAECTSFCNQSLSETLSLVMR